jgi:hypothetical protein
VQNNTAEIMEKNIDQIINLAITGGLLAVFILWFFLRNIRLVAIIALSIPISVYGAFNFFYAFDISINSLTLVGMALAIGMLVDNSVVVLENIYRLAGQGKDPETAVKTGTREIWRAVLAATLTTVIVFLPFIFSSNFMIKMIGKNIGVSIISTLGISLPLTDEGEAEWDAQWEQLYTQHQAFADLHKHGAHAHVHVDFWDGRFLIPSRFEAGGPDWFEIAIGNRLQYGVPLWQRNERYARLQAQWLPYYDDELRQKRLAEVKWFCRNNLSYIPFYVQRGLYFQAFDRLYNAFQEFLQLLFISQRRYPIAYNKWIREQIVEILGMPDLYTEIGEFLAIQPFQSQQLVQKAKQLESWIEQYIE